MSAIVILAGTLFVFLLLAGFLLWAGRYPLRSPFKIVWRRDQ